MKKTARISINADRHSRLLHETSYSPNDSKRRRGTWKNTRLIQWSVREHLAGAVRFATVSNADNSLTDYTKFDAFHEYLKETYPLVHKHLTLEHTDQAGLLLHWKGTGKSGAAPLLLMAHQDVVPEGDPEKWTYPPYSGTIADGKIWGRGSSDCKSNLIRAAGGC